MKLLASALVVVGLLYLPFIVPGSEGAKAHMAAAHKPAQENRQQPDFNENSKERYEISMELYRDLIITSIHPVIHKSLKAYYGRVVDYNLYDVKFLDIVRTKGYRTFDFIVKVQVCPFIGAYHTIGVDNLTISINAGGAWLRKFNHVKDYELPPHFKSPRAVL